MRDATTVTAPQPRVRYPAAIRDFLSDLQMAGVRVLPLNPVGGAPVLSLLVRSADAHKIAMWLDTNVGGEGIEILSGKPSASGVSRSSYVPGLGTVRCCLADKKLWDAVVDHLTADGNQATEALVVQTAQIIAGLDFGR